MIDWVVVGADIWLFLVAAVIFLALCRVRAAMQDQKLTRAGLDAANPLHVHLRHVIQSEDRIGIGLTITAFICGVVLAFMLADQILQSVIRKLVQILSLR